MQDNIQISGPSWPWTPELSRTVQYDYTNQAWVVDGRYVRCGHATCHIDTGPVFQSPEEKSRYCYGTQHVGERPLPSAELH